MPGQMFLINPLASQDASASGPTKDSVCFPCKRKISPDARPCFFDGSGPFRLGDWWPPFLPLNSDFSIDLTLHELQGSIVSVTVTVTILQLYVFAAKSGPKSPDLTLDSKTRL